VECCFFSSGRRQPSRHGCPGSCARADFKLLKGSVDKGGFINMGDPKSASTLNHVSSVEGLFNDDKSLYIKSSYLATRQ
jgi:hypothetical protein